MSTTPESAMAAKRDQNLPAAKVPPASVVDRLGTEDQILLTRLLTEPVEFY